ncbi:MAG: hypothetical protein ACYTFG_19025, partial [Planctomycetota bacterium]
MKVCGGKITGVFPGRKAYTVMIDREGERRATLLETGVAVTLNRKDRVGCVYFDNIGWYIIGKIVTPVRVDEEADKEKTVEQRTAEEQDYLSGIISGVNVDNLPNFRDDDEDIELEGEVALKSLFTKTRTHLFNDGSILTRVSDILLFLLSAAKGTALISAKRLLFRIVPGFQFRVGSKDKGENIDQAVAQKEKVSLETSLASDPEKPQNLDFYVEGGDLAPEKGSYGDSKATKTKQLTRGIRALLSAFGAFEVDNNNREVRFTWVPETPADDATVDPTAGPFQARFNDREAVLS